MGHGFAILLLGALGILLVWAGIEDVRTREIANWKNAAIALLAPAWWFASGLSLWPGVAVQVGVAAAAFALFVGAYAIGMMGGGDVKMIGALALWLLPNQLVTMLVIMSVAGGVVTLLMLVEHRFWRRAQGQPEIPYGVAIALAGLIVLNEPILNALAR